MGQTIAEAIFEEGEAKGRAEGLAEARAEKLREVRQLLRQLLEDRFGVVSDTMGERIETTTDVERIRAAVRQVLHITAPEELQL